MTLKGPPPEPSEPIVIETRPEGELPVTRGGLFIYSTAIAIALLLIIAGGTYMFIELGRQARVNAKNIERLDDLTERLTALTNPTPEQFRKQLAEGIKRCLKFPECRKLFPNVSAPTRRGDAREGVRAISGPDTPVLTATPAPVRRSPGGGGGDGPRGGGNGGGGGSGPGGGSGGAPPPEPTPAPTPQPPVDVRTDLPVIDDPSVCVPNILHVNCG